MWYCQFVVYSFKYYHKPLFKTYFSTILHIWYVYCQFKELILFLQPVESAVSLRCPESPVSSAARRRRETVSTGKTAQNQDKLHFYLTSLFIYLFIYFWLWVKLLPLHLSRLSVLGMIVLFSLWSSHHQYLHDTYCFYCVVFICCIVTTVINIITLLFINLHLGTQNVIF